MNFINKQHNLLYIKCKGEPHYLSFKMENRKLLCHVTMLTFVYSYITLDRFWSCIHFLFTRLAWLLFNKITPRIHFRCLDHITWCV